MTIKTVTSIDAAVDICDLSRSLASLAPPSSSKSDVQNPNDDKPAAKQLWHVAGNRARLAEVPIPGSQRPSFHPLYPCVKVHQHSNYCVEIECVSATDSFV